MSLACLTAPAIHIDHNMYAVNRYTSNNLLFFTCCALCPLALYLRHQKYVHELVPEGNCVWLARRHATQAEPPAAVQSQKKKKTAIARKRKASTSTAAAAQRRATMDTPTTSTQAPKKAAAARAQSTRKQQVCSSSSSMSCIHGSIAVEWLDALLHAPQLCTPHCLLVVPIAGCPCIKLVAGAT